MTPEEFVLGIKSTVHDSVVADVTAPPAGRKPAGRRVAVSNWYHSLPQNDQHLANELILQTVHAAIFGVLAVIDGARVIEDSGEKTEFRIVALRQGTESVVNPPNVALHDVYQAETWDEVFGTDPS